MLEPLGPIKSLRSSMSFAVRQKERAIQSIPFFKPNSRISSSSFGVTVGRSTLQPGRFTFFFSPIFAALSTRTFTSVGNISRTSQTNEPSAINIELPTLTELFINIIY